jgi:AcrR family transcriptional regulator
LTNAKPYHHGALREALLAGAEAILRRDGLGALSLRAIAREAGVSHGAPGHHFKDVTDLLSELAAVGFERLATLLDGTQAGADDRRFADGRVYVRFALENPALFQLMFRSEKIDLDNERLRAARTRTFAVLRADSGYGTVPDSEFVGAMTALWCMVHGFSVLAVDGRLPALLRLAPDGTEPLGLLDMAMQFMAKAARG